MNVQQYFRVPKVSAPPPSSEYINASLILSIQKRITSYTGDCWQIRRVSDNTLHNIGFDVNGLVSESEMNTILGAGVGRLYRYYDQKGTNNATAPATDNEPLVWNNGFIISRGKPTIDFEGTNLRKLVLSSAIEINGPNGSFCIVGSNPILSVDQMVLGHTTLNRQLRTQNNKQIFLVGGGTTFSRAHSTSGSWTKYCGFEVYNSSLEAYVYQDQGISPADPISYPDSFLINQIGAYQGGSTLAYQSYFSEIVFFDDITLADIASIKSDFDTYYT